ncbi:hypothetical protein BY458DRAFT_1184 [Sporodiniella umbellata]|nr:hypothetical protein BY458DRAFT_1184 [Sporodiniella umbellata]
MNCNKNASSLSKERRKYTKTDRDKEVENIIKKLKSNYKNIKDPEYRRNIQTNNKKILCFFSQIFEKYKKEDDINVVNEVYSLYDSNKSRFLKNIEICYKIRKNPTIYRKTDIQNAHNVLEMIG